jgi:amino acid transporter/nucleotide-binding universal stress UspA family protein
MAENEQQGAADGDSLERSLGLKEALTIGVGIMIGAGIFVFPGLAGGRAGPAAMVSFALGAVIALLVALPTAELATAMPRSGGGYHFVSRGLGLFFGNLVGVGQWLGLIFASAFYLAGFGFYASDLAGRLGLGVELPSGWIALVTGLALTAVAIVGTRTAGRLQDWIVAGLLVLLAGFLSYGLLDAFGVIGASERPEAFAPAGWTPVFGTAALVFTSYLGFQQVAVVSGEIRDPERNLPRALVGSVVLVGTLYILTMLLVTSFASMEQLQEYGETALAHVARTILGSAGGVVISLAGLLAALSSANASILSSSRAVFALSRDELLPGGLSTVNRRFHTPHVALLLTGLPIAGLALLGQIDVLAEVASTLHLILFGLVCFAMVRLRIRAPWWYQPPFRVPAGTVVATLGGLASFGLIAFMSRTTLLVSAAVVAATLVWFAVHARRAEIPSPAAPRPLPIDRKARFLLAAPAEAPPRLHDEMVRLFTGHSVALVGWTNVPEQATPEQVREELGDDAESAIETVARPLREADVEVDTGLTFTGDLIQSLEDEALEREVDVLVAVRPDHSVTRIVVPVPDPEMAPGLAHYTAWVAGHFGAPVELIHPAEHGRKEIERRFRDAGVPVADLHTLEGEADAGSILDHVSDADLIVMAESGPTEDRAMLGSETGRVVQEAAGPVMVVRLPQLFGG